MTGFDLHDPVAAPELLLNPTVRDSVRLIDARAGTAGRTAYAERHLEAALHADLDRELAGAAEDPSHGGRHPLPDLEKFALTLGAWGIGDHTPVVIYDDQKGANAAARLWWMLRAVDHRPVWVLDGGYDAAVAAGLPTSAEVPTITLGEAYPVPDDWVLPTIDIGAVFHARTDPAWRLVDVRAPFRFLGEREPIDPVAGHIPGAHNIFYEENLDERGRFLPADVLRSKYLAFLGDISPEQLVVQCGSGVTACHTLLALTRAGLDGAALYVGSWSEWCRREGTPREP